jgi:hypothetical protein
MDTPGPRAGLRAFVYAVGAALVAGILAWGIGEKTYDYYRPSARALSSRDFKALNREERIADRKNTAIVYGTLGALLGLWSGAAGGALRRSIPGGARAALTGLLLGGIGGALVGYGLAPIFKQYYSDEAPSLLLPLVVRGGIWGIVGMAAGLAFGWGSRGPGGIPGALIGGLFGAACGTIVFEVANGLLYPADRNDAAIPTSTAARLMACLFVSVGAAVGAAVPGRPRVPPAALPTPQVRA